MLNNAMKQRGFTIVELLVVIVVIAILAAITIVAYNGIQNRTNDSAVLSDLANLAKKLKTCKITNANDQYEIFTSACMSSPSLSKGSYGNNYVSGPNAEHNLVYCRNTDSPSFTKFALYAGSKSGKIYTVTDTQAINVSSRSSLTTAGVLCPEGLGQASGSTNYTANWYYNNSTWAY